MAGIFRCALRSRYVGVDYVNVLWGKGSISAFDSADTPLAEEVAACLGTELIPTYRGVLNEAYSVADITVERVVGGAVVETAVAAVGLNGTLGAGAAVPLPREVSMLLRLTSSRAGRSGKGRLYLPSPLNATQLTSPDSWATGEPYWTKAGLLGALLLTDIVDTADTLVSFGVYSRVHDEWNRLVGQARDERPHWLRSRMTAP